MAKKNTTSEEVIEQNNSDINHSNCSIGCQKGMIFSRLDYAVPVTYKGETMMVTPRGKLFIEHYDLLDLATLPRGITARKIS